MRYIQKYWREMIIILLLLCVFLSFVRIKHLGSQLTVTQNQNQQQVLQFRQSDSLKILELQALEVDLKTYKALRAQDLALIDKLKIKQKSLAAISSIGLQRSDKIAVVLRDSVIHAYDTLYLPRDTLQTFSYADPWLTLDGQIYKDSCQLQIQSRESLKIVESYRKKRFLFFKLPVKWFGYKALNVQVFSDNPHTEITGAEVIRICE